MPDPQQAVIVAMRIRGESLFMMTGKGSEKGFIVVYALAEFSSVSFEGNYL